MKIAIISDIHGNEEALIEVLMSIEREKIEKIICLGDIVGYGPNPNECVEIIKSLENCICLAGNHDWAAIGKVDIRTFNRVAREAIIWTQRKLIDENKKYLNSLPLTYSEYNALFVHASPLNPEKWNYIISVKDARIAFQEFTEQVCFIGHTHYPFVLKKREREIYNIENLEKVQLESSSKYLINVGSVGQPRDRNNKSSYGIFDVDKRIFYLKRVPYPIKKVQAKILEAGLDPLLSARLDIGT